MKYNIPLALIGLLFMVLLNCQKEERVERDYPQLHTSPVDHINADGARFNAVITSGSAESIREYGFVWGLTSLLNLQNSEKIVVNEVPPGDNFYYDVTFALRPMVDYYVRAYVISGDLTIYGDPVKFKSLGSMAPEITDFEPKTATWGDTVTLYGKNFSFQGNNLSVYFGIVNSKAIRSTDTYIVTTVPDFLGDTLTDISVELIGNRAYARDEFRLISYGKLQAASPGIVKWGDRLMLYGTFPYQDHDIKVHIGGTASEIVEAGVNLLQVDFPPVAYRDSVQVQLVVDNHLLNSDLFVKMTKPYINTIVQEKFGWEDTITITGLFDPGPGQNRILFDSKQAEIISHDPEKLTCVVPLLGSHTCNLSVKSGVFSLSYANEIDLAGPEIYSVDPQVIAAFNRIKIEGRYFHPEQTSLLFGESTWAYYMQVTSHVIEATIPYMETNGAVTLKVMALGKQTTYDQLLTYANPHVYGVSPQTAFYGDEVTITGDNINPEDVEVLFCSAPGNIVSATQSEIVCQIPNNARCAYEITVRTLGQSLTVPNGVTITPPVISSISPSSARPGETIEISGDFFNPEFKYNSVGFYIASQGYPLVKGEMVDGDIHHLRVKVPGMITGNYSMEISTGGSSIIGHEAFQCNSPWTFYSYVPNYNTNLRAASFTGNNKLYIMCGTYYDNNYQVIDFESGQFLQRAYGYDRVWEHEDGVAFAIGNKGYVGLGNKGLLNPDNSFYSFGLETNSWEIRKDFPGPARALGFYFSVGAHGYLGTGKDNENTYSDMWEYIPSTDTWRKLADYPGGPAAGATATVYEGKAYVVDGKDLYVFDPVSESWTEKSSFPGEARSRGVGIATASGIYYGTGSVTGQNGLILKTFKDFWHYAVETDTWQRMVDFPFTPRTNTYGSSVNNLVYMGCGYYSDESSTSFYSDFYQFDPAY